MVMVGVASGDEAEDVALGDDGQDQAVTEPVDQAAGAGLGGDAGEQHLVVGDAGAA